MSKLAWTPWHQAVRIRPDLRSGELPLAIFAADLHDVALNKARPIYQDPSEFFALTYPTFNLRELARDVVLRLAGRNDKAVRQLVLTYGGGKTHSLITLYHLAKDPARLPALPAVEEFAQHIGITPPKARIAVLAFDRLDPVRGVEVLAPDGNSRRFKYPWSVLAYQLGGDEGLRILGSEEGEREEPPFTNVLEELLRLPGRDGLATLVLIDEVLMWARTKIEADPVWRHRLQDFFQCLTQAATKVDTCAIVASLLATDPRKSDALGKQIAGELYAIFRREQEEAIEPVVKEDVAEILRRRLFTPDSIRDREAFRPHVVAALKGIAALDDQTAKEKVAAEDRFLRSFPFHPDLTEVFYAKWTSLEGFQRTRGVLRTFALALRDAERWDNSPLVAANVFLGEPGKAGLSEAARELSTVATAEEYEGRKQEWTGILDGELTKARQIQDDYAGLRHREIEQAVFATFLHSQPIGQKALTRELLLLVGHTRPDKIELEKALRNWAEVSWFLDEEGMQEAQPGAEAPKPLPKYWRLGSKPNLRQMHYGACQNRVPPELVEARLLEEIAKLKSLTAGASAAGAKVHNLPTSPADVKDDGEFHYAVLDPRAASDIGRPSNEARRFIDETTAPDRLRVNRNAVVLAAPSIGGLETARNRIRDHLGWEEVRSELSKQGLAESAPIRWQTMLAYLDTARTRIPESIRQAYSIVVTVSNKNEVEAFRIAVSDAPLFERIKEDARSRIQETAVDAEALLPGGPYELWREGENARFVNDLVGAFARYPHLPKMLNRQAILDTIIAGCSAGSFVLRQRRPDGSARTFWRQKPDDTALKDPGLEVVLPEAAELAHISPSLLAAGTLPGLWETPSISVSDLYGYFSGRTVVKVSRGTYEEPVTIPKAGRDVIARAVESAVRDGVLMVTYQGASILGESFPIAQAGEEASLQAPPERITGIEILPQRLPEAWSGETATAGAILAALSARRDTPLPWATARNAIAEALRIGLIELAPDSAPWPADHAGAQAVKLRLPGHIQAPVMRPVRPGVMIAEARLETYQVQDLADVISDLLAAAVGYDLKFDLRLELGGDTEPPREVVERINRILEGISEELRLR